MHCVPYIIPLRCASNISSYWKSFGWFVGHHFIQGVSDGKERGHQARKNRGPIISQDVLFRFFFRCYKPLTFFGLLIWQSRFP